MDFTFRKTSEFILLIIFLQISHATIINVPTSEYPTIQSGVSGAESGDTILVQPGVYYENVVFAKYYDLTQIGVTLASLFLTTGDTSYINNTIIDGNHSGILLHFKDVYYQRYTVVGFTLRNGSNGVNCREAEAYIRNCKIIKSGIGLSGIYGRIVAYNTIISEGSKGIYPDKFHVFLKNVQISNHSDYAIWLWSEETRIEVLNTTIVNNKSGIRSIGPENYLLFMNSILWNTGKIVIDPPFTLEESQEVFISHSIIQEGIQGIKNTQPDRKNIHIHWLDGNIDKDPRFENSEMGNFKLSECSPANGAGADSTFIDNHMYYAPTCDLDGNIRPNPAGTPPDLGAYESEYYKECNYYAPFILSTIPQKDTIITYIDTLTFYVNAQDPDGNTLTYEWFVNNVFQKITDIPYFILFPEDRHTGENTVKVKVSDGEHETSHSWIITVTPQHPMLYQNYPNPFNPSTIIEFDLPKTTNVTLKIFNILGEEMVTLVSDRLSAGIYSYEWSRPARMTSGIYLYRLETAEYVKIRKMVLMK